MSKTRALDPLRVHFDLKSKGSCFSDIARRVSKGARYVSPQHVRGVVYGYTRKNSALIWDAIESVLSTEDAHYGLRPGEERNPSRKAGRLAA